MTPMTPSSSTLEDYHQRKKYTPVKYVRNLSLLSHPKRFYNGISKIAPNNFMVYNHRFKRKQ